MKFEAFSSTAHRYARLEWSDEKNESIYGDFFSREGLGHNFRLVLELSGNVEESQPALDLIHKIDHKYLDENESYFSCRVSSLENITEFLFAEAVKFWPSQVVSVQIYEGESLSALRTEQSLCLKKLYRTRSAQAVYDVEVTFTGVIDAESGLMILRPLLKTIEQKHLNLIVEATLVGDPSISALRCGISSVEVRNALDNSLIKSLHLLD